MHLHTRQVPEIDGSQGAFIGLVVGLSVLIVACCAAVFYLLRHHEPTEQDRAARRERHRRLGRTRDHQTTLTGNSSSATFVDSATLGFGPVSDKVKQLWQNTTGGGSGRRRGQRGWIRAGSDDEWAIHSDDDDGGVDDPADHTSDLRTVALELGGRTRSETVHGESHSSGSGMGVGHAGMDGVRIVESPSSDTGNGLFHVPSGPYGYMYTDPYSKTATRDEGALQRSQSPLSSPVSSPRECASVDESHDAHSPANGGAGEDYRHDRHRSNMSSASVWTHSGSRFVEDI
ncbi:hypothetical protein JVU11DRAFT_5588 [Chiua virens]|nr:hypothetical protein JVU11DRAFT_11922 [Chiua virens]KAG9313284.1 hypothetical protein JVU11DRAFT_5588 [Chiua virens]